MLKENQNIDRLVQGIKSIQEDRCSLSDEEVHLLNECLELLEKLKKENSSLRKKMLFSKVIEILLNFFRKDIHDLFDGLL